MKAMVLFSGGVDSTTALALAVEKYGASEVLALSIYYGQKHKKELEAAQKVVNYYGVAWKQLDLTTIFADSNCSLLANSTAEIPQESFVFLNSWKKPMVHRLPRMCRSGTGCFWHLLPVWHCQTVVK